MPTFRMNKSQLPKPLSAEALQASADRIRGSIRPSSDEISDTIKAPTPKINQLIKILQTLILFGSISAGLVGLNILVMPTKLSSTKADKAELKAAPEPVTQAKTYLTASGTRTFRYLDGDSSEEPARITVVKSAEGALEEVIVSHPNGTNWNTYSCKPDGTYSYLYLMFIDGGKNFDNAGIKQSEFCHIAYDKSRSVSFVSVTNKQRESYPVNAVKQCPIGTECHLYKVNTKWAKTGSAELVLSEVEREKMASEGESIDRIGRERYAKRIALENEMGGLIEDCRNGSQFACEAVNRITR